MCEQSGRHESQREHQKHMRSHLCGHLNDAIFYVDFQRATD
jgi:hypothetical protein